MTGYKVSKKHFKEGQLYQKYSCLSCEWLLRDAVQSLCGHWFCQSCIEVLLETSNPVCPKCKENLKPDDNDVVESPEYFPDKFVRRDIDALELSCIHKESGCAWEGTFGKMEVQDHLANCAYAMCKICNLKVSTEPEHHKCRGYTHPLAQQGCDSGAEELENDVFKNPDLLKKHICPECLLLLRDAVQPSCGHWLCQICADIIIARENEPKCPNLKCGKIFEAINDENKLYFPDCFVRREISGLHVKCKFHLKGCDWMGTFDRLKEHLATCNYNNSEESLKTSTGPDQGSLQTDTGHEHSTVIAESLQRLESTLSDLKIVVAANRLAPTTDAAAVVMADGTGGPDSGVLLVEKDNASSVHKSASPKRTQYLGEEQQLTARLQARIQEEAFTKIRQEIDNIKRGVRANEDEIASLRAVVSKLEKSQPSKNAEFEDCDFRLSLIENSNHDGTMVWKIPQFNQRMSDARCGKYTSIFSLPFYTGRYGYKMCLRLYILGDGIGKGSYMSLFFVIMRGEFDSILQWPFSHKVTFKLINQGGGRDVIDVFQPDPVSSSFRRPKSDMNIASGCPRFVSHTELKSGGYIVDDTIFIKCAVDIATIKHP